MIARYTPSYALAVVLSVSAGPATAQDDGRYSLGGPGLAVGDPAPRLAVQEFVRGQAVSEFACGTVYVLEFWKCGCPPCRAAIPHLNDLQKKYPAVVFISVGVYSPTADNIAYVKRAGDQMGYRVAVDRVPPGKHPYTGGAMVQNWLEPAGEEGVPTSFVVDAAGRIAWIGHPTELDEAKAGRPLSQIAASKWDLKSAATKFAASRGEDARRRVDRLPKTERDAVDALRERAGRVVVDVRGNTVTGVRFDPRRVTDSVIKDLADALHKLKGLRDLDLCGADITDTGFQSLRGLTAIETLDISCTRVTDAGLANLRNWNDLLALNIQGTQVSVAGLKVLKAIPKLTTLDLSGLALTKGVKALTELPELHVLNLSSTGVTDGMLKDLRGVKGLRSLDLSNTRVTDAGVKELKDLQLGYLSLKNTRVEGAGLADLSGRVQVLILSGTRVTDAGLAALKRLPDLRHLQLDGTPVTDAGLAGLRGNRGLRGLSLTDTQVTDEGLPSLRDLKDLETLQLGGTAVTNSGLLEVERFQALTFLDVARTKATKAGVEALRSALPNLQIAY